MASERFYLTYSQDQVKEPIIYWVGHKFRVVTNIRGASVSDHIGIVALELDGEQSEIDKAARWIAAQGVKVEPIEKNVIE
ncbi:MAG TPA: NIL domain-containing protein [Candidatus Binatia bacterium]|jgi:ABC-type methionine transport system ATPase subunit|nr:NIL domain-containing protein [Candidatus Binatia bacterium]